MTMQGAAPYKMDCGGKKTRERHVRKSARPELPDEVVDRLAGLLPAAELENALEGLEPEQITGPGGLITQLAGRVIEAALGAELTGHLGYAHGRTPPGANHRNGGTAKTLGTDVGDVQIAAPRDRDASFEAQLVKKRQTRLSGLDDRILDMYAGGMSVRDIAVISSVALTPTSAPMDETQ